MIQIGAVEYSEQPGIGNLSAGKLSVVVRVEGHHARDEGL
jgi:hypothetical protein